MRSRIQLNSCGITSQYLGIGELWASPEKVDESHLGQDLEAGRGGLVQVAGCPTIGKPVFTIATPNQLQNLAHFHRPAENVHHQIFG